MRRFFALGLFLAACATAGTDDIPPNTDGGSPPADSGVCTSMCNGTCADLKTDAMNCGKCGIACPMGATCVQGTCQCGMGQTKCGANCVDTKSDIQNCGKCGTICGNDAGAPMGGGMWQCTNGACVVGCPMGKTNCSDACVDTQTDMDNCGMCGNACVPMMETCSMGLCCKSNEKVCNGKCIDVQSDAMNCGMCGKVCPNNTPVCSGGTCTNIPNGCKVVGGVTWCKDTVVGRSCNTFCTAIGLGNPTISDNNWLAAQNTQQLCTTLGQAFGLSFGSISSYSYGCAEYNAGSIICSTYASCIHRVFRFSRCTERPVVGSVATRMKTSIDPSTFGGSRTIAPAMDARRAIRVAALWTRPRMSPRSRMRSTSGDSPSPADRAVARTSSPALRSWGIV